MKKLLLIFALLLLPSAALAQCNGTFPAGTACGTVAGGPPGQVPFSSIFNAVCTLSPNTCASVLGYANIVWYGADPTGVANSSTAINNALANSSGVCAYAPTGTFLASNIAITTNGGCLIGIDINATIIKNPNASSPTITVANGLSGVHLSSFQLNRAVTATSGGDGIQWALTGISDGFLDNIWSRNNYIGFNLGPTALSWGYNLRAEQSITYGVLQTNNATSGGNQWTMNNVYVGNNGADGYSMRCDASAVAGMGTGNMTNIYSFANTGHGFSAVGTSSCAINSVRMFQFFLGQDGASELYLDTHGTNHQLSNGQVELAGTGSTGPSSSTSPSGVGHGIETTITNTNVIIAGVVSNGMSQSGFALGNLGINSITGSTSINNLNYGLVAQNGALTSLTDNYFNNNTDGNTFYVANGSSVQAIGNTPTSVNNNVLQSNGYIISGLPTCNSGLQGAHTYVTNGQTSPTYLGTVSTTGSVVAPVFCNGSGWIYG